MVGISLLNGSSEQLHAAESLQKPAISPLVKNFSACTKTRYLCRVHLSQLSAPYLSETKQTPLPITTYFKLILIFSFHLGLCFVTVSLSFRFIIIIFLHGLGRFTCSGIDELPSFPGASTVFSSSRFVVEGVFRESGVVHSFKVVDPVLFVFESHVLYSRDL